MSSQISLEKKLVISLTKAGFDVNKLPKAEVKALIDKSYSMKDEFESGWTQKTLDLLLAAALKFDDDGVLQVGFYNTQFDRTADMTASDSGTYIRKHGIYVAGGTCFAGGIRAFKAGTLSQQAAKAEKKGFFGSLFGKSTPQVTGVVADKGMPTYIPMITDGDNGDKEEFERELATMANTFVQIIAIGTGVKKAYLDGVASKYENVAVMYLPNPNSVSEEQFYDMILNKGFKKFMGV